MPGAVLSLGILLRIFSSEETKTCKEIIIKQLQTFVQCLRSTGKGNFKRTICSFVFT